MKLCIKVNVGYVVDKSFFLSFNKRNNLIITEVIHQIRHNRKIDKKTSLKCGSFITSSNTGKEIERQILKS